MVLKKLRAYLDENNVKYTVRSHSLAYSAQEIAHACHISGDLLAKTVMVMVAGKMTMVVVPADYTVDFQKLSKTLVTSEVYLASEEQFADLFPGCELGAMPPFGNLYDMPTLADSNLAKDEFIYFNAGNHSELVGMTYADFARLAEPRVFDIAAHCH